MSSLVSSIISLSLKLKLFKVRENLEKLSSILVAETKREET